MVRYEYDASAMAEGTNKILMWLCMQGFISREPKNIAHKILYAAAEWHLCLHVKAEVAGGPNCAIVQNEWDEFAKAIIRDHA